MPNVEGTPAERVIELTSRFDSAVAYARTIHAKQVRKGTSIAYLSHLLSVAALVVEDGATDEDLVIGALLHDAAEDCGGRPRLEDIRARFGDDVAAVVEGCTDTFEDPKPSWRPRKEAYIEHLREAIARREPFVVVSLADKLHNARAILADLRELGPAMFERFTAGREEQLWYYRSLVEAEPDGGRAQARRRRDRGRLPSWLAVSPERRARTWSASGIIVRPDP